MGNATAAVAQQKVEQFNAGLDFAAAASPLILLSALVALVAGAYGLKAARGCASSAHKFYAWKLACAVWAVLGGLLGRGSSVFQVALAVYFALVTRSFWLKLALLEASLGELPTSAPAPLPADAQRELLGYEKAKEEGAAAGGRSARPEVETSFSREGGGRERGAIARAVDGARERERGGNRNEDGEMRTSSGGRARCFVSREKF